jgi:hypothetical protein
MNMKLMVAVIASFCLAGFSTSASAFCISGDAAHGCGLPFNSNNSSTQSNGETTQQGFDAQTGDQWSTTSRKAGDVTFYSGFSSGNSLDGHQRGFGTGFNGPSFNSQNQADSSHCAFYGNCR